MLLSTTTLTFVFLVYVAASAVVELVDDPYEMAIARVARDPKLPSNFPEPNPHIDGSKLQLLNDICNTAWTALKYPNSKREDVTVSVKDPVRLPVKVDPGTLAVVVSMLVNGQQCSITFFYSKGVLNIGLVDKLAIVKSPRYALPNRHSLEHIALKKKILKIFAHKRNTRLHGHLETVAPSLGDRVFQAMALAIVRMPLDGINAELLTVQMSSSRHGVKVCCQKAGWSAIISVERDVLMLQPFKDGTIDLQLCITF